MPVWCPILHLDQSVYCESVFLQPDGSVFSRIPKNRSGKYATVTALDKDGAGMDQTFYRWS